MGICGLGVLFSVGREVAVVCDYLVLLCYMHPSGLLAGGQKVQDTTGHCWICYITDNVCRHKFSYSKLTQFLDFFRHEDTKVVKYVLKIRLIL